MKKRKKNPYQLTDEEKLAVVDLYAQFQTTSQIVDQVIQWKPHAATGDTEKDRKNVRDAIRTCNPKSSAFSFQTALTARRAEYLAEKKGTLVAAVCDTAQALAEGLSGIKFDFSSVPVSELPKIVSAIKDMVGLMEEMGITLKQDISEAVQFGEKLDQYPKNGALESATYAETRREMWAESEAYELGKSTQIETDTGRDGFDIQNDIYPSNYVIPDAHIKALWETLCVSENGKVPTVKQMREELDDPELYDEIYSEDGHPSFEEMLKRYQMWLSDEWPSYTSKQKQRRDNFNHDIMWEAIKNKAKKLGIETDGIYDLNKLHEMIDQAEGKAPLPPSSAEQNGRAKLKPFPNSDDLDKHPPPCDGN